MAVFFAAPALTVNAFGQEQVPAVAVQIPVIEAEATSSAALLPGQMPYFDIVPDPIETVN